jgi:peptidoglycan/xylan/chitin deacetylase (PgdA/CDA1 family)
LQPTKRSTFLTGTYSRSAPRAARGGPIALAALCIVLLLSMARAGADAPKGAPSAAHRSPLPRHAIRLAADDNGPFFSIKDLAAYTPVPRTTPPAWEIRPPIWKKYPAEVIEIPFVPREYPAETVAYLAEHEIRHGDRQKAAMALTFDCESGAGSTRKILETLRDQDVRATFFVLGRYAYIYPELIQQIAADGHEIGSHSFFHPLFTAAPPVTATQEIVTTEAVIDWAVGYHIPMRYFRFPYGGRNDATRQHAAALGYQSVFWDIDPRGWDPEKSREDVIAHVQNTAHHGGIVIMHCGSWDDANALAAVIEAIRARGMVPGTLTSVLTSTDRDVPNYPTHQP